MSRHDANPTREHELPPLPVSTTLPHLYIMLYIIHNQRTMHAYSF